MIQNPIKIRAGGDIKNGVKASRTNIVKIK